MNFEELGLKPEILKALDEYGYITPTEVQRLAIAEILNGRDVIVKSKTGSGKTAAFCLPILNFLCDELIKNDNNYDMLENRVIIVTPTRELSVQIYDDLEVFSKYLNFKTVNVYGQHDIELEKRALEKKPHIISGTPGRILDHIESGNLKLDNIGFFVLDEADKMLEMGFIEQVDRIISYASKDRLTMLFSATIPFEIQTISYQYMRDPELIEIESPVKTVDKIEQKYYHVDDMGKNALLYNLLIHYCPKSVMIFCNTRERVERVCQYLHVKRFEALRLHGAVSQATRLNTIEKFKNHQFKILVATDVAARGIHVDDLTMVINYDIPMDKDSYIHRIGRTGRAGKTGVALSLVSDGDFYALFEIEEHIGMLIPEDFLPDEAIVYKNLSTARELYKNYELEEELVKLKAQRRLELREKSKIKKEMASAPKSDDKKKKNKKFKDKKSENKYKNLENKKKKGYNDIHDKTQKLSVSDTDVKVDNDSNFIRLNDDVKNEILRNYKMQKSAENEKTLKPSIFTWIKKIFKR